MYFKQIFSFTNFVLSILTLPILTLSSLTTFASISPKSLDSIKISLADQNYFPEGVSSGLVDDLYVDTIESNILETPKNTLEVAHHRHGYHNHQPRQFHRRPRPYNYNYRHYQGRVCIAVDPWGYTYWGKAPNDRWAADAALWECGTQSGYQCYISYCENYYN